MKHVPRRKGGRLSSDIPLIGICALLLLLSSACDSFTSLFVTNDSSMDVTVYINGRKDGVIKAGTEASTGGVINQRIKRVEVVAVDSGGEPIANEPSARFEFPGGGTRGGSDYAVSLRVTGPPLHLEQIELKPAQKFPNGSISSPFASARPPTLGQ